MIRVSLLLPVYNAGAYLQAALTSVEGDLTDDVEVVAVDDGSTDGSGQTLERWVASHRGTVIHQANAGLVGALQTAVTVAKGSILARMDADDVNVPGRIGAARRLLEAHSDVVLVSPWYGFIRPDGTPAGDAYRFAWDAAAVDRALYVTNPIAHGAAVLRRDAYEAAGGYQSSACEDLHLWDRMSDHGTVMLIPQVLYHYRVDVDSNTSRNPVAVATAAEAIKEARWDRRAPATRGIAAAALRYRTTSSRSVHRAHLRVLGARSRARGDALRFLAFAAAYAVA